MPAQPHGRRSWRGWAVSPSPTGVHRGCVPAHPGCPVRRAITRLLGGGSSEAREAAPGCRCWATALPPTGVRAGCRCYERPPSCWRLRGRYRLYRPGPVQGLPLRGHPCVFPAWTTPPTQPGPPSPNLAIKYSEGRPAREPGPGEAALLSEEGGEDSGGERAGWPGQSGLFALQGRDIMAWRLPSSPAALQAAQATGLIF